jgi:ABC-type Zn uptake system ZnuABC Zn-binding protein ZnuA
MIESAAYDINKRDGIQEGQILNAREMLIEAIQARFDHVPADISAMVERISDRDILKLMLKQTITAKSIDALRKKLSMTAQ